MELTGGPLFKGKLGELIFEYFADTRDVAYNTTRRTWIEGSNDNFFTFYYKNQILKTPLSWDIVSEVKGLSKPSNRNDSTPTFIVDYLAVSLKSFTLRNGFYIPPQLPILPEDLRWVEVKYRTGQLSENQKNLIGKTKIPITFFQTDYQFSDRLFIRYHPECLNNADDDKFWGEVNDDF